MRSFDSRDKPLIVGINRCRHQVVSRRQPQPVTRVKHREILEVRIRIADQQAGQNPPEQAIRFRGDAGAGGCADDESAHVLIRALVLVIAGIFTEQLVELFEVNTLAGWRPVEA